MKTIPYIYKWTQISTGKWYIGSRTRKGYGPERHESYLCSSKIVKPMILDNRSDWVCDMLMSGNEQDQLYIRELEARLLNKLNAKSDPMSYNRHNGDGQFTGHKLTGISKSDEWKRKNRKPKISNKNYHGNTNGAGGRGKPKPTVSKALLGKHHVLMSCIKCKTTGGVTSIKRWHVETQSDACKFRQLLENNKTIIIDQYINNNVSVEKLRKFLNVTSSYRHYIDEALRDWNIHKSYSHKNNKRG